MDEDHDDLGWHALNYRTAAPQHAEAMWQELLACVERKVAAERERWTYLLGRWVVEAGHESGAEAAVWLQRAIDRLGGPNVELTGLRREDLK